MACLDKETATAYLSGYLEATEAQQWSVHVQECRPCQLLVEEVSGMVDEVRKILVLGDSPALGEQIPPAAVVMNARSRQGGAAPRPLELRSFGFSDRLRNLLSPLRPPIWVARVATAAVLVIAVSLGIQVFSSRSVLHASDILRRAEQAAGNARTIPDRIIRRVWSESIVNGLGPLGDGNYRLERWFDNVEHRAALIRYDHQGQIREGSWLLSDGTTYSYRAYDLSRPELVIGPSDSEMAAAIDRLDDAATRERVRESYQKTRRPLHEIAAELTSQTEREVADASAGKKADNSVHEVVLASGQKLFRVSSHVEITEPDAVVAHWDITRLILDQSFLTIEIHSSGYRSDGIIYQRSMILRQEQVFLPGEADLSAFSPGPFPPSAQVRHVSAQQRVEAIQQQMRAGVSQK